MPLTAECPYCGQKVVVSGETTGRPLRCPACDGTFNRPEGTAGAVQAEAPRPMVVARRAARLPEDEDDARRDSSRRLRRDVGSGPSAALILGVVALALGVLALIISWVPFVGLFGLIGSLPGLVLGIIGAALGGGRRSGRGIALAGAGLSLFAVLIAMTSTLLVGVLIQSSSPQPSASGPVDETPVQKAAGWGDAIDPDRDCSFRLEDKSATITVPATPHDLSAELGRLNAPRVLRDVDGDFTAQVKVCGVLQPAAPGTVAGRVSFQSGGLLLWQDNQNYLRFERAALQRGAVQSYASLELRVNGRTVENPTTPLAEQDTYLRLERHGDRIRGSVSPDGRNWTPLRPMNAALPARLRVGVAVINAAQQPLTVRFEDFQVSR